MIAYVALLLPVALGLLGVAVGWFELRKYRRLALQDKLSATQQALKAAQADLSTAMKAFDPFSRNDGFLRYIYDPVIRSGTGMYTFRMGPRASKPKPVPEPELRKRK